MKAKRTYRQRLQFRLVAPQYQRAEIWWPVYYPPAMMVTMKLYIHGPLH